jgi:hypothetical protein
MILPDTTGFSRVVLQLQPKRKLPMILPDTTGFKPVVSKGVFGATK